jgi:hypothetical protein
MERKIPVPLTAEDLRRDPDLILAVHAHARHERARLVGVLLHAAVVSIAKTLRRAVPRLRPARWASAALVTK